MIFGGGKKKRLLPLTVAPPLRWLAACLAARYAHMLAGGSFLPMLLVSVALARCVPCCALRACVCWRWACARTPCVLTFLGRRNCW